MIQPFGHPDALVKSAALGMTACGLMGYYVICCREDVPRTSWFAPSAADLPTHRFWGVIYTVLVGGLVGIGASVITSSMK